MRPDVDPLTICNRRDVRHAIEQERADIDGLAIPRNCFVKSRQTEQLMHERACAFHARRQRRHALV